MQATRLVMHSARPLGDRFIQAALMAPFFSIVDRLPFIEPGAAVRIVDGRWPFTDRVFAHEKVPSAIQLADVRVVLDPAESVEKCGLCSIDHGRRQGLDVGMSAVEDNEG